MNEQMNDINNNKCPFLQTHGLEILLFILLGTEVLCELNLDSVGPGTMKDAKKTKLQDV